MWQRLRQWWPVGKALLAVVILVAIGRQFALDLQRPEVWQRSIHPGWLIITGVLYLLGLGFSALYWYRLLRRIGQEPSALSLVRAYYIGHLGKYVPGKAWALLLRATLVRGPKVRPGYAGMAAFYETLTTMTTGVLLAAILLFLLAPDTGDFLGWYDLGRLLTLQAPEPVALNRWTLVLLALFLLVPVALPVLPPLFNRLAHRLSLPFRDRDEPLPKLHLPALLEGLALTAVGWSLLGASLWAGLRATAGDTLPWSWELWGRATAFLGVAYVAGFVLLLFPGGLGIREIFLTVFLVPEMAQALALSDVDARVTVVQAVLVLRLVWTVAELLMAGIVFWLPAPIAVQEGVVA